MTRKRAIQILAERLDKSFGKSRIRADKYDYADAVMLAIGAMQREMEAEISGATDADILRTCAESMIEADNPADDLFGENIQPMLHNPLTLSDVLRDDNGDSFGIVPYWREVRCSPLIGVELYCEGRVYAQDEWEECDLNDYGVTWRYWASMPTPEECAAAPWEE